MKFEWDDAKRVANIHKHGIDFINVADSFKRPLLTWPDNRHNYDEARFVSLGLLGLTVVVIVYTYADAETIRLISVRRANKHEQKTYFSRIQN